MATLYNVSAFATDDNRFTVDCASCSQPITVYYRGSMMDAVTGLALNVYSQRCNHCNAIHFAIQAHDTRKENDDGREA